MSVKRISEKKTTHTMLVASFGLFFHFLPVSSSYEVASHGRRLWMFLKDDVVVVWESKQTKNGATFFCVCLGAQIQPHGSCAATGVYKQPQNNGFMPQACPTTICIYYI